MTLILIGTDKKTPLVDHIIHKVTERGCSVNYLGPKEEEGYVSWSEQAGTLAKALINADDASNTEGILLCWTGTGVCIAANKVPGVRAALCVDAETAKGARLWNNANILCLSMRLTTEALADEILESWFTTTYIPNPSDDACLAVLEVLDNKQS